MTPELQVQGHANVFALGDVADADLKTAGRAGREAEVVVANIRALVEGGELQAYEPMPPAIVIPLGPSGGASELPGQRRDRRRGDDRRDQGRAHVHRHLPGAFGLAAPEPAASPT